MNTHHNKIALIACALVACAWQALALDAIVIANESTPSANLTMASLKDIYTGKTMFWEGGQAVTIVWVEGKSDGALKEVSGMDPSTFKTFWRRLTFSGRGQQPKKADDAAAALTLVASTKGAIAIVPADTEAKGVKKLDLK